MTVPERRVAARARATTTLLQLVGDVPVVTLRDLHFTPMDDGSQDLPARRTPLAKRQPAKRVEALETESAEVVDRVASLLGKWATDDTRS